MAVEESLTVDGIVQLPFPSASKLVYAVVSIVLQTVFDIGFVIIPYINRIHPIMTSNFCGISV